MLRNGLAAMKFIIDDYKDVWQYFWDKQLVYLPEEHSFYMGSSFYKADIELCINAISITIIDNIVVNVNGFCGLDKSMVSNIQIPNYKKGILRIEHDLKFGFAYNINEDEDWPVRQSPVYINSETGWVCIGYPEKKGDAVEFIKNCVAVIDDDKQFMSLWLKPEKLPDL